MATASGSMRSLRTLSCGQNGDSSAGPLAKAEAGGAAGAGGCEASTQEPGRHRTGLGPTPGDGPAQSRPGGAARRPPPRGQARRQPGATEPGATERWGASERRERSPGLQEVRRGGVSKCSFSPDRRRALECRVQEPKSQTVVVTFPRSEEGRGKGAD